MDRLFRVAGQEDLRGPGAAQRRPVRVEPTAILVTLASTRARNFSALPYHRYFTDRLVAIGPGGAYREVSPRQGASGRNTSQQPDHGCVFSQRMAGATDPWGGGTPPPARRVRRPNHESIRPRLG